MTASAAAEVHSGSAAVKCAMSQTATEPLQDVQQQCQDARRAARGPQNICRADVAAPGVADILARLELYDQITEGIAPIR